MKTILIWAALLLGVTARLGETSTSSNWQHGLFNRNSRNFMRRSGIDGIAADSDVAGTIDIIGDNLSNGYNELFTPYVGQQQQQPARQEPSEVYGIVEPLIEDTPCVDRVCLLNEDCCPTGVCVNTYGEGKCIYVYGRKRERELCQRHSDCVSGSSCMLLADGSARCQFPTLLREVLEVQSKLSLGSECRSSDECQVAKGMCCQKMQHHGLHRYTCGYFRDAFDCIDMTQPGGLKPRTSLKQRQN